MTKLKEYKMYINGTWVDAENKKTFKTLNPENNEPWAVVPEASAKDVNNAVEAAQKAFDGKWSQLMPKERANYLRAIANQLRENAEMLGRIETIDTGKLFRETKTQANYIAEYYDYFSGLADKVEGDRKSTRLNSSHALISYAVFCLKKKSPPRLCTHTD